MDNISAAGLPMKIQKPSLYTFMHRVLRMAARFMQFVFIPLYDMVITSRSSAFKAAKQYVPVYGYATGALLQTVDAPSSSVH